ncbi:MAG: Bax inhibitor-1/YccA family protein [Magnetovibrionaceae bacterium]
MAFGSGNRFGMNPGAAARTYAPGTAEAAQIDADLRQYMLKVYNYMACGVLLTGIVAMGASTSAPLMQLIHGTPLKWVVMLAPLGFAFFLGMRINAMSVTTAQVCFWAFAGVMGISLSYIFLAYTGESVARVFFITAGAFAGLSIFGYTTKKNLSGLGTFLMMGLIGIIIASLVNIFLASSALAFVISVVGVLVFAGLTAYDTQRIKSQYLELRGVADSDTVAKMGIMGALTLYLDFINLFIMLLQLFGQRE